MRLLSLVAGAVMLALATPASAQVYVTRHADTPAGERDPALTAAGTARAQALAAWFRGKRLRAIYVTEYKRTRATAAPLATSRGLTPVVYDPADTPALVAKVRALRGPVLVVGHSNTVPEIVAGLGGERPDAIPHERFGDVWTVKNGRARQDRVEPKPR